MTGSEFWLRLVNSDNRFSVEQILALGEPTFLPSKIPARNHFECHCTHLRIDVEVFLTTFLVGDIQELFEGGHAVIGGGDFDTDANLPFQVVLVNDVAEATHLNRFAAKKRVVGIGVIAVEKFSNVVKRLKSSCFGPHYSRRKAV